ncbi:hypothetical protein ACHWQZ_G011212 [Mnemiopsis leidyi]
MELRSITRLNMPTFSKFIDGQRGSQQMVDSDGFIYSRKKPRDTPLYSAWRCRKNNPPTKCPCHAYLTLTDNSFTLGSKPHNHPADNAAKLSKRKFRRSLTQVKSDYHINRLGGSGEVGKTPSKRRKTSHEELFKICSEYADYSSKKISSNIHLSH